MTDVTDAEVAEFHKLRKAIRGYVALKLMTDENLTIPIAMSALLDAQLTIGDAAIGKERTMALISDLVNTWPGWQKP